MIDKRLIYGDIVEYEEGHYSFERWVMFKHPESGDWISAALYQCTEKGAFYVREKEDFVKKFTFVPQPVDDTVEAQPMFNEQSHCAWGANCPHCERYWESLDTERESPITCDGCEQEFKIIYPGSPP